MKKVKENAQYLGRTAVRAATVGLVVGVVVGTLTFTSRLVTNAIN